MLIALPDNIFGKIFSKSIDPEFAKDTFFVEPNKIIDLIESDAAEIGLVPSCYLIQHKELFVSSKVGITFDGTLSTSYLYYKNGENTLEELYLTGDVTPNEVILSKIIFKEKFDVDIKPVIDITEFVSGKYNYLMSGDKNFSTENLNISFSFTEEVCDLIKLPYVNFVFVAKSADPIKKLNWMIDKIDNSVDSFLEKGLKTVVKEKESLMYIKENSTGLFYSMTDVEVDALKELMKLIYYHGLVDDIFDIKFIG